MILPSGPYKDRDITQVPSSYLRRLLGYIDDDELREAIEEELSDRTDHSRHFEDHTR